MHTNTKAKVTQKLIEAFSKYSPDTWIDDRGYVCSFEDNLLPLVSPDDFEAELGAGGGNELRFKFRAAHSSSALAVNNFAPFKSRLTDLRFPQISKITNLQFEAKCKTGLGGTPPHLDVLISNQTTAIGVESKLTEYLGKHNAYFSPAYSEKILDERREQAYFREMQRLSDSPTYYKRLDAAQLIKHAFGLARSCKKESIFLCYLFWEPANPTSIPAFAEHRAEIAEFTDRVAESRPSFFAMSYLELWALWKTAKPPWLAGHLDDLEARYLVTL